MFFDKTYQIVKIKVIVKLKNSNLKIKLKIFNKKNQ